MKSLKHIFKEWKILYLILTDKIYQGRRRSGVLIYTTSMLVTLIDLIITLPFAIVLLGLWIVGKIIEIISMIFVVVMKAILKVTFLAIIKRKLDRAKAEYAAKVVKLRN